MSLLYLSNIFLVLLQRQIMKGTEIIVLVKMKFITCTQLTHDAETTLFYCWSTTQFQSHVLTGFCFLLVSLIYMVSVNHL